MHPGSQVAVFDTYSADGKRASRAVRRAADRTRSPAQRRHPHQAGAAQGDGTRGGPGPGQRHERQLGRRPGRRRARRRGQNVGLVTVAVSQADAERLILLSENGLPYLALLTPFHTSFDAVPRR